jgi:1,4-dihydroxy-6-naphthoate synthase
MWWPLTGKVDPVRPGVVLSPPALDTHGIVFTSVPEDIQKLNKRAIEEGDLDITAVSFATLPHIWSRYAPTACGSSFGDDWGPKLVMRHPPAGTHGGGTGLTANAASAGVDLADAHRVQLVPGARIAIPGRNTTAWIILSTLLPQVAGLKVLELPFDKIVDAVAAGDAEYGLLIHESQLTFQHSGLMALLDLGLAFKRLHGLPLPLGSNAVRRDLDARFGPGTLQTVVNLLDASVRYALAHRAESLAYAKTFSPLKDDATLDRYITLYVNKYTVDARPDGARAAELMLRTGATLGLLPAIEGFAMLGASA